MNDNFALLKHRIKVWWQLNSLNKRLKQTVYIVVAIGICYGMFLYLSGMWKTEATSDESVVTTFESVLVGGSVSQMIRFADAIQDDQSDPMPIRIENLKNKTQLGRKIERLAQSQEDKDDGARLVLEACFDSERVYQQFGQSSNTTQDALRATIQNYLDHRSIEIRELAHLIRVYGLGLQFANVAPGNLDAAKQIQTDLLQSVDDLAEQFPNRSNVVATLMNIMLELREYLGDGPTTELLKRTIAAFASSSDPSVVAAVKTTQNELKEMLFGLDVNSQQVLELQNSVLDKQTAKAQSLIKTFRDQPESFSARQFVDLVHCILWVTQSGHADIAQQLVADSKIVFESKNAPAGILPVFKSVATVIPRIGERLDLPELDLKSDSNLPTVVVWGDPENALKTQAYVKELSKICGKLTENDLIHCVVMLLSDETVEVDAKESSKRYENLPEITFIKMNPTESKQLLQELPITWLPTCGILDGEGRLVHLSPTMEILQVRLLELTANVESPK